MKIENLKKLFVHEAKDLYDAERQILEALPRMIEKAGHEDLRAALNEHLDQTSRQADRLEKIDGEDPAGQHCSGMEGLIEEGKQMLAGDADPDVLDAGIIASAQRIEHYEISGYGTAATYAEMLDNGRAAELLRETLSEEKNADQKLNEIAKQRVNPRAAEAG